MIKEYEETHQKGLISIEKDLKAGLYEGNFGVQIAKDGRVWICIDGQSFIRFKLRPEGVKITINHVRFEEEE